MKSTDEAVLKEHLLACPESLLTTRHISPTSLHALRDNMPVSLFYVVREIIVYVFISLHVLCDLAIACVYRVAFLPVCRCVSSVPHT